LGDTAEAEPQTTKTEIEGSRRWFSWFWDREHITVELLGDWDKDKAIPSGFKN